MLSQRIQQQFIDSADFKYQCAQVLATPIDSAIQAIFASVTNGGKVLVAGAGVTQPLAQYLSTLLLGRFERTRPDLAAVTLGRSLLGGEFETQGLAREVRALGVAEDLLLVLSAKVLQALQDTDVAISIPSDQVGRVLEIHQMILHCICDGIDVHLLGDGQ